MHVTVLMAAYNACQTVEVAVQSIRWQTYTDWELLIVDDGSTDGTADLLQCLATQDPRISVVRNPVNRGLAASLNIGLRQARGELIARMDADDVSLPQRLERQVAFMQSHPEVAVLGSGAEFVDERGRFLGVAYPRERHEELARKIYKEVPLFHPTIIARRGFYLAMNGYDEHWLRCEDADLWLRSYRRFRFHNLQEALIRYRQSNKLSMHDAVEKAQMLSSAALRERRLLPPVWYALRWLIAGALSSMGLYMYHINFRNN